MGVLNFSTENLITGVNVIDGNLYWTDNNSEPKKLEIDRFRDYNHTTDGTQIRGELVLESDLSVIRLHPWQPIILNLQSYRLPDVATIAARDALTGVFAGQNVLVTADNVLYEFTSDNTWIVSTRPEPPFEQIFPRFSYRWRYEDGQYSPYAPFTQAAFIPGNRTEGTTNTENYTEGFNTTMFNNVGKITLNDIPRGPRDVVAIDLLYTESISSTVYVLETIDIPPSQRGFDFILSAAYTGGTPNADMGHYNLLPLSYELSARKIYSALPANQLTRPYDEVPQRAKAQEITANRLIYANYQIGFDQPDPLQIATEFVSAGDGDGLHVKGNRTYEIGVAYIDPYGRQGAMVQAGSITTTDGRVEEQVPLTSAFNQTTRQQIRATINSDAPSWADRYRYFIKDPSMDHHNLISYNIYNDGGVDDTNSEFVWIEFQSTDRNKVQAEDQTDQGTVLVLRRTNGVVATAKQRFLVQDIQNEAPDDVRRQVEQVVTNTRSSTVGNIGPGIYDTRSMGDSASSQTNLPRPGVGATQWAIGSPIGGSLDSFQIVLNFFNRFISQNQGGTLQPASLSTSSTSFETVDLTQLEANLFVRLQDVQNNTYYGGQNTYVQITGLETYDNGGTANTDGLIITLGQHINVDPETSEVSGADGVGWPGTGITGNDPSMEFITTRASDEAIARLGGRFWVRTSRNDLTTLQSEFTFEGELTNLQQIWFETEPIVAASNLDLFWESSDTFCVKTEHGYANTINWFNCVAEVQGGVYLESTRINDKFNSVQLVKGVRVNTPTERNEVITRPYDLTWSGIYNGRTSINRLNEFITADGIEKRIEPNYGSIQRLHTRSTNLVVFSEDKVFNILADKDLLFNADGGGNVAAANVVLGQTTAYTGEYGIGRSPESFATYGYRAWFADPIRGVVVEFIPATGGQSQLREISEAGMSDFFRDRLFSSARIWGMFNDHLDKYVISLQGYDQNDAMIDPADRLPDETNEITLGYELDVQGWPSFMSFIPEGGISLNNKFYTWKNGQLWLHNSNTVTRNNFYGTQYNSEVAVIFNDEPSSVKEFLTLSYEGTDGWEALEVDVEDTEEINLQSIEFPFVKKEGKYFKPLVFTEPIYEFLAGEIVDSGRTREKSGIKGFFNNVRFRNSSTTKAELFAINTENYISSR